MLSTVQHVPARSTSMRRAVVLATSAIGLTALAAVAVVTNKAQLATETALLGDDTNAFGDLDTSEYHWQDAAGKANTENALGDLDTFPYTWADKAGGDNADNAFGDLDTMKQVWHESQPEENALSDLNTLPYEWHDANGEANTENAYEDLDTTTHEWSHDDTAPADDEVFDSDKY